MIKRLKLFFCLILAVIMPFSLLACKSSETVPSSENSGGGETPSGGDSIVNPPAVNYVLDNAEIDRVLDSSYETCKEFIGNLNKLNLSEYDYGSNEGGKTYPVFDYAFYPARFVKASNEIFEKNSIYAIQVEDINFKYLKIDSSDENDKIFVKILIDEPNNLTTYFYEFRVQNGVIKSLKLSFLSASSSSINFADAVLDFENSVCEIWLGKLIDLSSIGSKRFLEIYFTEENFDNPDYASKWGYSYYQKFVFGQNKSVTIEKTDMPNNEPMIARLNNFGFLDSFEILDEYDAIPFSQFVNLKMDYFSQFSKVGIMSYDNGIFKISEGE